MRRPFYQKPPTMRIKILHPIRGTSFFGGEIIDVESAYGSELVATGAALMIPDTEIEPIRPIKAYVREEETVKRTALKTRK